MPKTDQEQIVDILKDAHDELENANQHSLVDTAENMYEALRELVSEENQVVLAQTIADVLIEVIDQ